MPNSRKELVTLVAEKTGIESQVVDLVVTEFLESFVNAVANGSYVQLRPYFSAHVKQTAPKLVRNITAGTTFTKPASYKPVFKPSKTFVEKVLQHYQEGGEE